jgi:hypothetical protein
MPWIYLGGAKSAFTAVTPDSQVAGKKPHEQQRANSWWIYCAKHVINLYRSSSGSSPKFAAATAVSRSRKKGAAAEELFKANYASQDRTD